MKIRFYYYWSHVGLDAYGHEPRLWDAADTGEPNKPEWYVGEFTSAMAIETAALRPYSLFLCSALHTDLHNPEHCEWVLKDIARLESGGIEHTEWDGQGFQHYISRTTVTLEHTIFGECPEWPTWHCSLSRYKAALVAWKLFLEMPISIDSEVIVELPND